MKSIAVFCASSLGKDPAYAEMAFLLGATLAKKGIRIVYGGSKIGLMGMVAGGALKAGGEVIGVLPGFMASREIAHDHLTELIMVESMQERKLRMHELSDGVITLPGGFGTFEELFEMVTWGQLGLHKKPIGILNFKGYYNHLIAMVQHMADEGLLKQHNAEMLQVHESVEALITLMENYIPPAPLIKMKRDEA